MDKLQVNKEGQVKMVLDIQRDQHQQKRYKVWVICSMCEEGRWVRTECLKQKGFTGFCLKCHNKFTSLKREKHPSWKGGRHIERDYICVRLEPNDPYYPMATTHGYIREHRLVMARHLGRCLQSWEVVHHKNRNKQDNRFENLELFPSRNEHIPSMAMQATIQRLEQRIAVLEKILG